MSQGKKWDVFISYARGDDDDRQIAEQLENLLTSAHLEVFRDTQVQPGTKWREKLREALDASENILVLLTPTSVSRPWVWVETEAALSGSTSRASVWVGIAAAISRRPRPSPATRLRAILVGIDDNDARLSPISDIQLVGANQQELVSLLDQLTENRPRPADWADRVKGFVDLCDSYPGRDSSLPLCQERGKNIANICEAFRSLHDATGKANQLVQHATDFHDLMSNGVRWFGQAKSDDYTKYLKEVLWELNKADPSWKLVLVGTSMFRFFTDILEGRDEKVQRPFESKFVDAVKAGMAVNVLLGATNKETDESGTHHEPGYCSVSVRTNLSLKKIAELTDEIGLDGKHRLQVRLTDHQIRVSLIWLTEPDEDIMLATHYMRGGLHNFSHSIVLKGQSRVVKAQSPVVKGQSPVMKRQSALIELYRDEFDWYWRDQPGPPGRENQRVHNSRAVIPRREPNAEGNYFDYATEPGS